MRDPTQEEAQAFLDHLEAKCGVEINKKEDSNFMQTIAGGLGVLGIVDKKQFMESFATTIDNKVWIPSGWTAWSKISVAPHEVRHGNQAKKDGFPGFAWAYLTDEEQRYLLECEAYVISSEMHFWRYREVLDPNFVYEILASYAVSEPHRALAKTYIEMANITVARGSVANDETRIAIEWLEKHCPDIRLR